MIARINRVPSLAMRSLFASSLASMASAPQQVLRHSTLLVSVCGDNDAYTKLRPRARYGEIESLWKSGCYITRRMVFEIQLRWSKSTREHFTLQWSYPPTRSLNITSSQGGSFDRWVRSNTRNICVRRRTMHGVIPLYNNTRRPMLRGLTSYLYRYLHPPKDFLHPLQRWSA